MLAVILRAAIELRRPAASCVFLRTSIIFAEVAQFKQGIEAAYARIRVVWRLMQSVGCENGFLTPSHKVACGVWLAAFPHREVFRRLTCL